LGDAADALAGDGTCKTTSPNECTLRAAIEEVNAATGAGTYGIRFGIPGEGPYVIRPASALPVIINPVVLDASTQPGFVDAPIVELDGSAAGVGVDGLVVRSGDSLIRGLVIRGFSGSGIRLELVGGNRVQGNWIGTDGTGFIDQGNAGYGLVVETSANLIGGTDPADRNLVSGNDLTGILISGAAATGNTVEGNYIGVDVAGSAALRNTGAGVFLTSGASGNSIGGTTAAARNLISGNGGQGIRLSGAGTSANVIQGNYIGTDWTSGHVLGNAASGVTIDGGASNNEIGGTVSGSANVVSGNQAGGVEIRDLGTTGNLVQGNRIGTDASGLLAIGNVTAGVYIHTGASDNGIGGTATGAGNLIANNTEQGIRLAAAGQGNSILRNAIRSNGLLGIDLEANGVTPNDDGDADTGSNDLQNYPVLTSAIVDAGLITIEGGLNSTPDTGFRVEFFASAAADPTGYGEAERYLGSLDVATDPSGNAVIRAVLSASVGPGEYVTATATNPAGSTSEFARNTQTAEGPRIVLVGRSLGIADNFSLARYDASGALDSAFGVDGRVTISLAGGNDRARGVAVQVDGRIVAAGSAYDGSDWNFAVARYDTDGTLDGTFGGPGWVTTDFALGDDFAYGVVVQPDGKILVAGFASNGSFNDLALARYYVDGSPDLSFGGGDGQVLVGIPGVADEAYAVALMGDGRIVVAGRTRTGGNWDLLVARFGSDGSLDTSFSGDGIAVSHYGQPSGDDEGYAVAVLSDDSILVGGRSVSPSTTLDFAVARFTYAGDLDTGFGVGGVAITPIGDGEDAAYAMAVQPDERIILAGFTESADGDLDFALVRYTDNGLLDNTFGGDGIVITAVGSGDDQAYALALQPDGRILAAGTVAVGSESDFVLARYSASGVLDTTLGSGGIVITDVGGSYDDAFALAYAASGIGAKTFWLYNENSPLEYMMHPSEPVVGPEASSSADISFYSDIVPVGLRVNPGEAGVSLYVHVPLGFGDQNIILRLWAGSGAGWTPLGSVDPWMVSDNGEIILRSGSFPVTTYTFGPGERLRLDIDQPSSSPYTTVYWDGIYSGSRVGVP
jgi:uncharacterized delta-60 repeat protein